MMENDIKIIGFDADDTLWINEPFYQNAENEFCEILKPYFSVAEAHKELFKTEIQNLEMYGYGAKGFILSMIETALRISGHKISSFDVTRILEIGRNLLNQPVVLLNNVEMVLQQLQKKYKIILATKGDLLDQERKLVKSGLAKYFHHIEIMSDKQENNYKKLIHHLDIEPRDFIMIGNSIKSDILPVINIGAKAIHVPFETTWLHEKIHEKTDQSRFVTVSNLDEVLKLL